jgi:hypothetical protein
VTTETGHHGNTYVITVGGTTHAMDAHGRVANGPTDLLQWEGCTIRRAFLRGSGEHAVWTYLEAAPREAAFSLLGEILFLGGALPGSMGFLGILLVMTGLVFYLRTQYGSARPAAG